MSSANNVFINKHWMYLKYIYKHNLALITQHHRLNFVFHSIKSVVLDIYLFCIKFY